MKIFQISNRVPWPLNEGGTIGIYNYTRAFAELGHSVTLYCLDGIKHQTPIKEATQELSKYAQLYIHPIDTDVKPQEVITHLLKGESYNVSRFYNKTFEDEIAQELKREKYDVVQLEGTFAAPYIDIVRKHHAGLVSLRMHNVEYEIWERLSENERNPIKKWYLGKLAKQLKAYEEKILKKVDTVVPVTENDVAKFKKMHANGHYMCIPAGIDLRTWVYRPTCAYQHWYHIGSMEWHGNVDAVKWYIDKVHQQLADSGIPYMLHLAGKGIDTKLYSTLVNSKVYDNVPSAVDFVTPLDICVVPLRSGSGIRLKILEAMAAGKVVVCTTIGAQGINCKHLQTVLIADTPAEFAELLAKMHSGEIDMKSIANNARKLVEQAYSTEALAQAQLTYYSDLMDSNI